MSDLKTDLRDTGERALWTFIQAFTSAAVVTDVSTFRTAALAGLAAVISVVKSLAVHRLQKTEEPGHPWPDVENL